MNEYRTNTKAVEVNVAPLFASCWLALFNELRESFYEAPAISEIGENLTSIIDETSESAS